MRTAKNVLPTAERVPWRTAGSALLALAVVLFPLSVNVGVPDYNVALLTRVLILGLFGLGYDIVMGYTGMVSFGHAAFLGLGAYGTGLLMLRFHWPIIPAMLGATVVTTLAATLIGFFSIRLKSVYFALLTFAFAQIFYQIDISWTSFTGGYDGVPLSFPMQIGIPGVFTADLRNRITAYYFALLVVVLVGLLARRVVASPFGHVLVAIRENEQRAATMGYDVARYKHVAFIVSGAIGSVAGALFVPYQKFISADLFFWELSGLVVIIVQLGGMGTGWGAFLGALIVVLLQDKLSNYTPYYLLPVGVIFVLLVMFLPEGLAGLLRRFTARAPAPSFVPQEAPEAAVEP